MMEKEKAAWQAFKEKDADGFKKVVDHDMVGIYADGIADMAKEMSDMKKWDMKSFAISDYKSHSDEKDVVVTSYVVTIKGTFDGKDASGTYNAGSCLENGGRQMARHLPHQRAEERIVAREDQPVGTARTHCGRVVSAALTSPPPSRMVKPTAGEPLAERSE